MNRNSWTDVEMAAYAAAHGLENTSPEEIERMAMLAAKVTAVGARLPRMSSKEQEPANAFKVPQ
jgi:hypothetical protein